MDPRGFYSTYQSKSSSCDEYLEMITYLRDVISHCGRFIGNRPFLVDNFLKADKPVDPYDPTDDEKSAEKIPLKRPIWPLHFYQVSTEADMACYRMTLKTTSRWDVMSTPRL